MVEDTLRYRLIIHSRLHAGVPSDLVRSSIDEAWDRAKESNGLTLEQDSTVSSLPGDQPSFESPQCNVVAFFRTMQQPI